MLTHEYVDINLAVVADSVDLARSDYREYVRQVADFLRRSGSGQGDR